MSDDRSEQGNGKREAKRPSHYAYQVNEGQEGKSYFNKVGAAFEHRDRQGYNILLESVPVDGRVTLRTPQERLQEMRAEPQQPAPQAEVSQQQTPQVESVQEQAPETQPAPAPQRETEHER